MPFKLGRADDSWPDMSEHVAHLVKSTPARTPYENIIGILSSCRIEASGPFGAARTLLPPMKTVSFSETPIEALDRMFHQRVGVTRDDWHGIGFTKEHVVARGGGPVLYAYEGTPHHAAIEKLVHQSFANATDPFRTLAPFIELVHEKSRFEWEREWRIVGDFSFDVVDVAFLIMPETFHESAWGFFEDARNENTGPHFFVPYVDATWDRKRILDALKRSYTPGDPNPYRK